MVTVHDLDREERDYRIMSLLAGAKADLHLAECLMRQQMRERYGETTRRRGRTVALAQAPLLEREG